MKYIKISKIILVFTAYCSRAEEEEIVTTLAIMHDSFGGDLIILSAKFKVEAFLGLEPLLEWPKLVGNNINDKFGVFNCAVQCSHFMSQLQGFVT